MNPVTAPSLSILDGVDTMSVKTLRVQIGNLVDAVSRGEIAASDFWAAGAMHPDAEVRLSIVRAAADRPDDDEAAELLSWAIKDVDDRVAIVALRSLRGAGAIDEVFDTAGRALGALDGESFGAHDLRRGTAIEVLTSLLRESADPDAERARLAWTGYEQEQSLRDKQIETEGMVEIAAGEGVRFAFYIDRFPVTVAQYGEFLRAVQEWGPAWSHPGQPAGHDHDVLGHLTPAQLAELADHPVTAVSWFDAWAYAAWAGKKLPTAAQWELAAGVGVTTYPWGEQPPSDTHANLAYTPLGDVCKAVNDWPDILPTHPVTAHPSGATAHGVQGLLGNVWEWTRSRYLDEHEITPFVGAATLADTLGDWTLVACIKGGSWATVAEDLNSAARAGKHVLQRGLEAGFRCVAEPLGE